MRIMATSVHSTAESVMMIPVGSLFVSTEVGGEVKLDDGERIGTLGTASRDRPAMDNEAMMVVSMRRC